jgi:hypothetical protein
MENRTKSQIMIGLLAFFASMWIIIQWALNYAEPLMILGIILLLLVVMLVLSYILISILEWMAIFDLKTNAVLTLIVLTTFMITLTIYLLINNTLR